LPEYVRLVSQVTRVPIPVNTPIVGQDAFRTATGVHAAAVIKAQKKGHSWLADRIYSGVPAGWIGRTQQIEIGPMSGNSNVQHYLASHGVPATQELTKRIIDEAKKSPRVLTDAEILELVRASRTNRGH